MKDNEFAGITPEEMAVAGHCLEFALSHGASKARVNLAKNVLDSVQLLCGEVDKVSRNADKSIVINLFVDGKYGSYSTNRVNRGEVEEFILKSIQRTRMLTQDEFRQLPDPKRCAKDALTGLELGLYDREYENITPADRLKAALCGSIFSGIEGSGSSTEAGGAGYRIISEECEYSDSVDDSYVIDSQGFAGRHTETSFSFWSEITIMDDQGNRYSGYEWSAEPFLKDINIRGCSPAALAKAVRQINPRRKGGGKFTMVVDNLCSSRLVAPLLQALNASSIQQRVSFLEGSLGKKVFPEELTVRDFARTPRETGSRLFDSEGVATGEVDIISRGRVNMYFANTYFAGKLGIEPTVDAPSRPGIKPFVRTTDEVISSEKGLQNEDFDINLQSILDKCGEGILVTGFNGGNYNNSTGYFSYGVEGFAFNNGKVTCPIREMVITGDFISLWNNLIAAGSDARHGVRWQIPTLAFKDVDFSGQD